MAKKEELLKDSLRELPLEPFLRTLPALDIHPTLPDYQRIHTALRANARWTRGEIRDLLASLLTRSKEQQGAFLRHFDRFFQLTEEEEEESPPRIDVEEALEALRRVISPTSPPPPRPETEPETDPEAGSMAGAGSNREPPPKPPGPIHTTLFFLIVIVVSIALAVSILFERINPPTPAPAARLCPQSAVLNYGPQELNSTTRQLLNLKNCGDKPLTIERCESGNPAFQPGTDADGARLLAGEELPLPVTFNPKETGNLRSELLLHHSAADTPTSVTLTGFGIDPHPTNPRMRRYEEVPVIEFLGVTAPISDERWRPYAQAATFLAVPLTLLLAILHHRRRLREPPECSPFPTRPSTSQRFRLGRVGGAPPPQLPAEVLDEIAETLGHYQSEHPSHALDISATLHATLERNGIPTLRFQRHKEVRGLLILEDALAEASRWNPIAEELATAMPARGIPVIHGHFHGSPLLFRDRDGHPHALEDLETKREGLLLLIFTDGKGIGRHPDSAADRARHYRQILEELDHWPKAAWMELREPRAWDDSTPRFDPIPLFPATADGLLEAVRLFLSEALESATIPPVPAPHRELPLTERVERHLGDALAWGQECALLHPSIPLGLAHKLLQRRDRRGGPAHPHLTAQVIERLHTLPGTVHTAAGLRLSDPVRKVLRGGFIERRSMEEQEAVLRLILEEVDRARPEAREGELADLEWQLAREKIRFELEPDKAYAQLARLEKSAATGPAVRSWLNHFREAQIPFLRTPVSESARRHLAAFDGDPLRIGTLDPYRPSIVLRASLLLLSTSMLGLGGWSAKLWLDQLNPDPTWLYTNVSSQENDQPLIRLEKREGESWVEEGEFSAPGDLVSHQPEIGETYRFRVFDHGVLGNGTEITVELTADHRIALEHNSEKRLCSEWLNEYLEIQRCPSGSETEVSAASWRERVGENAPRDSAGPRLASLALEITNAGSSTDPTAELRDRLLRSGSVDAVYRAHLSGESMDDHLAVLSSIKESIVPGRSQLLSWDLRQTYRRWSLPQRVTSGLPFSRNIFLATPTVTEPSLLSWPASARNQFDPAGTPLISEDNFLYGLTNVISKATGTGDPIVLLRPTATTGTLTVMSNTPARLELSGPGGKITGRSGEPIELGAGTWQVSAFAPEYLPSSSGPVEVSVKGDHTHSITLVPEQTIAAAESQLAQVTFRTNIADTSVHLTRDDQPPVTGDGGALLSISPGTWRAEITAAHHEPLTTEITVGAGEELTPSFTLTPLLYALTVNTQPQHAEVRIAGVDTPYEAGMPLTAGRYDIEITAKGFQPWRERIELTDDLELSVSLTNDQPAPTPNPGFRLLRTWQGHNGGICKLTNCLAFSPDGRLLASGSAGEENTLKLWSASSGELLFTHNGSSRDISGVTFSPDGRWLASTDYGATARIIDVRSGQLVKSLKAPASLGYTVTFTSDGKWLLLGTFNPDTVFSWSTDDWSPRPPFEEQEGSARSVAVHPRGEMVAIGNDKGITTVWSWPEMRLLHTSKEPDWVNNLQFAPDGSFLALSLANDSINLRDPTTGELLRSLTNPESGWGSAFAIAPSGELMGWGSHTGSIQLIETESGATVQRLTGHVSQLMSLAFSPDGKLLATADDSGVIKLWTRSP